MTLHTDSSRPPIYEEDGVTYYRASALGGCINELVLFRRGELGAEKTTYIEKILEAGNEYEPRIRIEVAQQIDRNVVTDHESVQLEVMEGHVVTGTTDGRLSDDLGIEIKTLGPDSFKHFVKSGLEKFPEYQWQLSVYMLATELPWLYVAAERDREEVEGEYEFSVNLERMHMLPIIYDPPVSLNRIKRKIRRINTLAELEMEELPMCEKAKFCSMTRFHDLIGGNVDAEQAEQLDETDELYQLLLERQRLKDLEDETSKARKEVDAKLKGLMEGPAAIAGVGRWTPILSKGADKLDKVQIKIDLGEEFDKYVTPGSPYQYIRFDREKG